MAPASYIIVKSCQLPCNISDVIILGFLNTTSAWHDEEIKSYDSAGAMKFIITTLLVYSLMGISGMLLLRIRRRASRTHRVVTVREEHLQQYIKRADDLKLAGYRHKLKMDASRMVSHLQNLELQRSFSRSEDERNRTNDESSSLLSPTHLTGQSIHYIDSPKYYPNMISPSRPERFVLSPLPEEYIDVKSCPVTSFSFCETCGTSLGSSFTRFKKQVTWAETSHSPTCSNNITTENESNNINIDDKLPNNESCSFKYLQVSEV